MSPSSQDLLFWGASDPVLLAEGEFWRLFTANFVHVGLLHLWFNVMGLQYIGPVIEGLLGKKLFLFIYILSGLYAVLASAFFNLSVSAGASGALFGLVGVGAVFESLYKARELTSFDERPPENLKERILVRLRARPFLSLALINVALAFVVNTLTTLFSIRVKIDNAAHLGGMLAGAFLFYAVTYVLSRKKTGLASLKFFTFFGVFILSVVFFSQKIFFSSYVKMKNVEKASEATELPLQYYHYTQALRLDPVDERILFERGAVALIYGDLRGAIRDIHEALLLGFPRSEFLKYTKHLRALGKEKEAVTLEMILKAPRS